MFKTQICGLRDHWDTGIISLSSPSRIVGGAGFCLWIRIEILDALIFQVGTKYFERVSRSLAGRRGGRFSSRVLWRCCGQELVVIFGCFGLQGLELEG